MSARIASDSGALWNFRLYEVGRDIDVQLCGSLHRRLMQHRRLLCGGRRMAVHGGRYRALRRHMFSGDDGLLSWSNDGARWARDVPVRD